MVTIRDLGVLRGEVLVFGGPYSNAQATQAMLGVASARGVRAANLICTGDLVAYCADPVETVRLIRGVGAAVVAGNCERQLAAGAEGCGCGFEAGSACDRLSAGWYAHATREVGAELRAWMGALPDIVLFTHAGQRHAVIHGGVREIARFLWPVSTVEEFAEEIAALHALTGPVARVIAGHCGLAFHRQVGRCDWINAGAIGLPPHDGRGGGRYLSLSPEGRVRIERLDYDPGEAVAAMAAAGLTQGYHETLESGVWPSEDVLPQPLRRG